MLTLGTQSLFLSNWRIIQIECEIHGEIVYCAFRSSSNYLQNCAMSIQAGSVYK